MKWVLAECDEKAAAVLTGEAGLHPLIARLLVNRGIMDPAEAKAFLAGDLSLLSSPLVFGGMERAAARIQKAISSSEKIVVYGDYDVDGVTGTALLYLVLKDLGAEVDYYIPNRLIEGYGLNSGALEKIRAAGSGLVITIDCGISAFREAAAARLLGLDLIITDHHEISHPQSEAGAPPEPGPHHSTSLTSVPDAYAVLHPEILVEGTDLPARGRIEGLTGVGVAFKLAQALLGVDASDDRLRSYLDLVTLGTIADVGRVMGENRVLVKHGLDLLSGQGSQRPGIAALKQVAGLNGKKITTGTVGFTLAPRINASGRLEKADMAFRLLTSETPELARSLASALDAINRERQNVEEHIHEEARSFCRKKELHATGAFVLSSETWHPGVIGIVASRIVEEFYRPAALICVKDGVGKGSARSIPGFDLYHGLVQCSDLLSGFGGHKYAAGFSIPADRIPEFRERLGSVVMETIGKDGFVRTQMVDCAIELDDLTLELMGRLERLAPFGQGNPEPRLGSRGLLVLSSRVVGNGHLKIKLQQRNGAVFDAIAFNRASRLGRTVRDGMRLAAVFTPRVNTWNGNMAVELEIKDIKIDKHES